MFAELDVVALTHNIEEFGLSEGSVGAIVQLYKKGQTFAVEFVDEEGYTIALIDLTPKDVRRVWSKNLKKEVKFSDYAGSESKDKKYYISSIKYSKSDPVSLISHKFVFV